MAIQFRASGGILTLILLLLTGVPAYGQVAEAREVDADAGATSGPSEGGSAPAGPDLKQVAQQILERTNRFRREHGREPVRSNQNLAAAAQYFADYMARTGRYGHTADGKRPADRAETHGYSYCLVSENIAYQYSSDAFEAAELAEAFTQGWINSPGHRKNMLEPAVVDSGVAVARGDSGTYYAVQMFGRPESMRIEFKVSNRSPSSVAYVLDGQSFPLPPRVTRTHQRCRVPELRFVGLGEKSVTPQDGEHYVIRRTAGGRIEVTGEDQKEKSDE